MGRRVVLLAICAAMLLCACWAPTALAAPGAAPGGPVALVTTNADHFGAYYTEILRAEGLNAFSNVDAGQIGPSTLAGYDVVLLAPMTLTDAQVAALTTWVHGGGNLIAMRPDPKLAGLLGLSGPAGTLADGYLAVDTTAAPGAGIAATTMQFHGVADRYTLAGARAVATLYSSASAPTPHPAVTLRGVGTGRAAAFTYDLARSVVFTRQGNPAWAGQERDNDSPPGETAIRSDDLFFGGSEADWVDLSRVAVPQADEQQRLLANLVTHVAAQRMPLPRFWYFPRGERAIVVMTGDDHSAPGQSGITASRFEQFIAASPAGCSVADWECVRATSYVYPTATIHPADATLYQAAGFEIGLHPRMPGRFQCNDFTSRAQLNSVMSSQLAEFADAFPGVAAPSTVRTHCIIWSDWASQPKVDLAHGIRLNTDYYYWPASWVQERPGMFTGSGIPMRFADLDGSLIDVYQATTQIPDESTDDVAGHIAALLDGAVGSQGFYGAFTVNMHNDGTSAGNPGATQIVAAAQARGVPVVSSRQLLTWLDGREASTFQNLRFDAEGRLTFTIAPGAGARGLEAMLPIQGGGGSLSGLTRDGQPVTTSTRRVKGVDYAVFPGAAGSYVATYPPGSASAEAAPASAASSHESVGQAGAPDVTAPRLRPPLMVLLANARHAPMFPRARRSATRLRPGGGRAFSLLFRLPRTARVSWTVRTAGGRLVASVRSADALRRGRVLRLRWDGRRTDGRFAAAGDYRYTVTVNAGGFARMLRGTLRVLPAG